MIVHKYGMRLRPAGIGCQPKGFVRILETTAKQYWNILLYPERLSETDMEMYSLDYLGEERI